MPRENRVLSWIGKWVAVECFLERVTNCGTFFAVEAPDTCRIHLNRSAPRLESHCVIHSHGGSTSPALLRLPSRSAGFCFRGLRVSSLDAPVILLLARKNHFLASTVSRRSRCHSISLSFPPDLRNEKPKTSTPLRSTCAGSRSATAVRGRTAVATGPPPLSRRFPRCSGRSRRTVIVVQTRQPIGRLFAYADGRSIYPRSVTLRPECRALRCITAGQPRLDLAVDFLIL